jgi:uncharacterized secreted protein with C-terminal beta-propeller domain
MIRLSLPQKQSLPHARRRGFAWLGFSCLSLLAACSDTRTPDAIGETSFESDDPDRSQGGGGFSKGGATSSSGASVDASATPTSAGGEGASAARTIEEADIIKVDGDRLYALSKFGGLSIVDTSNPDALRVVGRLRMDSQPFEMYVRGSQVFVMLNDYGHYDESYKPYGKWVQSSEMIAIDVSNPSAPREFSHFDVPGTIADSRLVGDVIYLVTHENGSCWRCSDTPSTIISSFSSGAQGFGKVDQIAFSSPQKTYNYWQRSVSATNERLYVAGPEWNWDGQSGTQRSIVQVVDIKDPTGKLRKGADVPVNGQINSRWQMDEFEGVLRVVSQSGNGWGGGGNGAFNNPKVQTFTINSSDSIAPLGQTDLVLKKRETLRSVRFDGKRAYAITAEQKDPLFTIDLSDPAKPKALGELEMPGWLYHMEPRGDRMIGLGYDQGAPGGSLNVSLFDVSDLSKPKMIKRVNFGEGWAQLSEDQDRIQKSFKVLDNDGVIVVPFSSYGRWTGNGCSQNNSGIQLIDYSRDDIKLEGIVPQKGQPRRAIVKGDTLFGVTDRSVSSFSIANRAAPVAKHEVELSNPAYRIAKTSTHVAQVTNDWWSSSPTLSFTPIANVDNAQSVGSIALSSLIPQSGCGFSGFYDIRLFANGDMVYLVAPVYNYNSGRGEQTLLVAAVDASNPAAPKLVGTQNFPLAQNQSGSQYSFIQDGYGYYSNGLSVRAGGQGMVQVGSKIAMMQVRYEYPQQVPGSTVYTYQPPTVTRNVLSVDFSTPSAPRLATSVKLPDSLGATPLLAFGGQVVTTRWNRSAPGKVKFWMDRIDLAGADPQLLPSVNVPGTVLQADAATGRISTVDYRRLETIVANNQAANGQSLPGAPNPYSECRKRFGQSAWLDYPDAYYAGSANGQPIAPPASLTCVALDYKLNMLQLQGNLAARTGILNLEDRNIGAITATTDRVFVTRYAEYDYENGAVVNYPGSGLGGGYREPLLVRPGGISVIGGVKEGRLTFLGALEGDNRWPLATEGTRLAMLNGAGLSVYETAPKPGAPAVRVVGEVKLRGYGYSSEVMLSGDKAICALGDFGLQSVALTP